jgi:hypothetical protein
VALWTSSTLSINIQLDQSRWAAIQAFDQSSQLILTLQTLLQSHLLWIFRFDYTANGDIYTKNLLF